MGYLLQFEFILKQVFEVLIFAWPVTLILFSVTGAAVFNSASRLACAKNLLPLICLMIFPLVIIIIGVNLTAPVQYDPVMLFSPHPYKYASDIVDVLFWLHLVYGVWVVIKLKGMRLVALSIALLTFWLTVASDFIASMSVSGVWL